MTDIPIATPARIVARMVARDLRAVLPRVLIFATFVALVVLRLAYVRLGIDGFGDPSARGVLMLLDAAFAGLTLGGWFKDRDDAGLLLMAGDVAAVEVTLFLAGGY